MLGDRRRSPSMDREQAKDPRSHRGRQAGGRQPSAAAHASPEKFPELAHDLVRDKIGAFAGLSGRTVEKMRQVCEGRGLSLNVRRRDIFEPRVR